MTADPHTIEEDETRPDLLVVISPDHWVNFFISNLPAVCIGIGEEHDGPPEPFMQKVFPRPRLQGHPAFGRHLLQTALDGDFEPALSHRLKLDHGTCIPLWRIGIDPELPIVPLLINDLEEPMPSIRRCLAWAGCCGRAVVREVVPSGSTATTRTTLCGPSLARSMRMTPVSSGTRFASTAAAVEV